MEKSAEVKFGIDHVEKGYAENLESSLIAQEIKISVVLPTTPQHQQLRASPTHANGRNYTDFTAEIKLRRQQSCWSKISSEKRKKKKILSKCGFMFLSLAFLQGEVHILSCSSGDSNICLMWRS